MEKYQFSLTEASAAQIKKQLINRHTPTAYLRLGVKGSGCAGYEYILKFEDSEPTTKDLIFESYGVRLIIDSKSIIYLNNSTLDWEYTLLRQGFKFNNPQEVSSCGCGASFSL